MGMITLTLVCLLAWSIDPNVPNEAAPIRADGAVVSDAPLDTDVGSSAPESVEAPPVASSSVSGVVTAVVDGDTFKVEVNGQVETVRIIGIDTPETVHPEKLVECFGLEASRHAKTLLSLQTVAIRFDPVVGKEDRYGRWLVYATLPDGRDFGEVMIRDGYAYEYTYDGAYAMQATYRAAEAAAQAAAVGLWGEAACERGMPAAAAQPNLSNVSLETGCLIKGNINADGERIYHQPGQRHYEKTVIDEQSGEQWFCSIEAATAAGWRAALQ